MATTTYVKRLRMDIELDTLDPVPALPPGFVWVPWDEATLPTHAEVKWRSFRDEFDTRVFPNLAEREGCLDLMREICGRPGFIPAATWLVAGPGDCCGTVQGLHVGGRLGMIQNLGVVPECRGLGLGSALLLKALHGFRRTGLTRACLEVTARNLRAVRLYHRAGFASRKTLFREVAPLEEEWYSI
jgi:ribosomal protein S18 acetylase RimI-like enzyme